MIMKRHRGTLVALGAALLTLVGACAAPAAQGRTPPGPPAELAQFYDQRIAFEPCAPYATTPAGKKLFADGRFDCARVQVPLDYADPDGPRGEVALLRVKASGERIGSLLVNPGGPGASGMNYAALVGSFWDSGSLQGRFDVIGFDPRGVGASTPRVDCYSDAEYDSGRAAGTSVLPGVRDEQAARELARRCADGSGGAQALTSVATSDTVRDMDVLRAVLGDEKLSYFGASYGSELGAMYAEAFPRNVRAIAVDGAINPELGTAERSVAQYTQFQRNFDTYAADCTTRADCPLGPDPARTTEVFHAILRPLQDKPAPTTDGRGLSYDDAVTGVLTGLRIEAQWPKVVEGLAQVAAGRGDGLLALRDSIYERGPDGRYAYDTDSFIGISCMDRSRRTPAEQTDLARQLVAAAPILDSGRPVVTRHDECEAWPEPSTRPEPWLTGDVDVPPTLVVSVTGDPATPHEGGITMAHLLGASLLTVEGKQHGVALINQSTCVDDIVGDYLINLRTPPADARCIL
jgi:pimeloyl-ACP methyl ester carboxylesterase